MTTPSKRLGRGLRSLISADDPPYAVSNGQQTAGQHASSGGADQSPEGDRPGAARPGSTARAAKDGTSDAVEVAGSGGRPGGGSDRLAGEASGSGARRDRRRLKGSDRDVSPTDGWRREAGASRSDTDVSPSDSQPETMKPHLSDSSMSLPSQAGRAMRLEARMVPVTELRPNQLQPRRVCDEQSVSKLAESIAASGVVQPLTARETEEGLEIIAGERRWRAARLAGLNAVPVLVRSASDEQMLEFALVENIHREGLNAVDRGQAYREYCETFDLTVEAVARRLGEDRTTVTNYVRLLELPEAVRALLAADRISMGHARALLGVAGELRRIELATMVAGKGMSVRALEELVRREKPRRVRAVGERRRSRTGLEAHVRELEEGFESVLQTKVRIHLGRSKGSGRVVIEFFCVDDFERIAKRIGVVGEEERRE